MTFPLIVVILAALLLAVSCLVTARAALWLRARWIARYRPRHCSGRHTYPWLRHRRIVTA